MAGHEIDHCDLDHGFEAGGQGPVITAEPRIKHRSQRTPALYGRAHTSDSSPELFGNLPNNSDLHPTFPQLTAMPIRIRRISGSGLFGSHAVHPRRRMSCQHEERRLCPASPDAVC
jgi:hypothetical protein